MYMQHRQQASLRGMQKLLHSSIDGAPSSTAGRWRPAACTQHPGAAEGESLHAYLSEGLARLRAAFGEVLAVRLQEATMYPGLRDSKVDTASISSAVIGK